MLDVIACRPQVSYMDNLNYEIMNVVLPTFIDDIRLCIVHTLSVYLSRSEHLRNRLQLSVKHSATAQGSHQRHHCQMDQSDIAFSGY